MQNYVPQYNNNVVQQPSPVATNPVSVNQTNTVPNNACAASPNTIQVPNYSGVNIQIINPSVAIPGGSPIYNVNAPQYQPYPAGYYTNNWANPANNQSGNNANVSTNTNTTSTTTNINKNAESKKTVKREIVKLTDDYIKNLENFLNSQDKQVRLMGAKEVIARLKEDESRKDDKALTALINKMLQDPYEPVRFLALTALNLRQVTGDDYTVGVLQKMQGGNSGYGRDALDASKILLKMSGQTVKKEFEANNDKCEKKE